MKAAQAETLAITRSLVYNSNKLAIEEITFPIVFEVFKPQKQLKEGEEYKTKPKIAGELIEELVRLGFSIECVLSDSLYGENEENFLRKLEKLGLQYMVSIRSSHEVWLPA